VVFLILVGTATAAGIVCCREIVGGGEGDGADAGIADVGCGGGVAGFGEAVAACAGPDAG
jgi:hypothetical protein